MAAPFGARIDLLRAVRGDVDVAAEEADVRSEVAALVDGADVELRVLVEHSDDVVTTITEVAERGNNDLLVIGASGEKGLRTALFGTIPDIVADRVPCSVLLVRRYVPEHWAYRTSERIKRLREQAGLTSSAE
jgi:nucleotide-binding universal stress UspA family protein